MSSKQSGFSFLSWLLALALSLTVTIVQADAVDSAASVVDTTAQAGKMSDSPTAGTTLAERTGAIATTPVSEVNASGESISAIMRVIGALCAVLALMWVAVAIAKRFLRSRPGTTGNAKQMTVNETLWLGPKKQVVLMTVGSRQLVIGVTEQSMTTLSEFGVDELAGPRHETGEAGAGSAPPANHFNRLLQQAGGHVHGLLKRSVPAR